MLYCMVVQRTTTQTHSLQSTHRIARIGQHRRCCQLSTDGYVNTYAITYVIPKVIPKVIPRSGVSVCMWCVHVKYACVVCMCSVRHRGEGTLCELCPPVSVVCGVLSSVCSLHSAQHLNTHATMLHTSCLWQVVIVCLCDNLRDSITQCLNCAVQERFNGHHTPPGRIAPQRIAGYPWPAPRT